MKSAFAIFSALLLCSAGIAANLAGEESITVTVIGTLRTGIVAIGGETTGTTITANKITWELAVGKNAKLQKALKDLDGKKVTVQGTLERRSGVEIKERWIVKVSDLQATVEGKDG